MKRDTLVSLLVGGGILALILVVVGVARLVVGRNPAPEHATGPVALDCGNANLVAPSNVVSCADPELTQLADELDQAFKQAMQPLDNQQGLKLVGDQLAWNRSYTTTCGVPPGQPSPNPIPTTVRDCFKRAAEVRLAFLRSYRPQNPGRVAPSASQVAPHASQQDVAKVAQCAYQHIADYIFSHPEKHYPLPRSSELYELSEKITNSEDTDRLDQACVVVFQTYIGEQNLINSIGR